MLPSVRRERSERERSKTQRERVVERERAGRERVAEREKGRATRGLCMGVCMGF